MTTAGNPKLDSLNLDKAQWHGLLARSNRRAALQFGVQAGLILGFGTLIFAQVPFWQLLLLPQGLLLIFLFAPLHECIHRTAFRNRWCNVAVAHLCGWLLLLPPTWFRHFHLNHHRFTNDPARDPELATAKPASRRAYLIHLTGLPIWWSQIRQLLRNALGQNDDNFIPRKAHRRVTVEAVWFIALYFMAYRFVGEPLLWAWVVPVAIGQPFLRAFLLAEHWGCPDVRNMLANSRTTFTTAPTRLLCWNMSYHAEHHAQPAVPFHRLPQFHEHTKDRLRVTQNGYGNLHRRIFRELG